MSRENVDLVRRFYEEGLFDQDPEWLLELATPDITYVNPEYAIEPGVRRGPEAVVRAMRGFAELWVESRHELHELFDAGDLVVAEVTWYTRTRESDTELVQEEAHTWAIRDGLVASFEWGTDLSAALRSAGLSP